MKRCGAGPLPFRTSSERETLALGARLGRLAQPPLTLALSGPLGSGKTVFVRGFLRGLGHRGRVRSPTFALVHEYRRLRPRAYHLDLYRLRAEELPRLGLEEYLGDPGAACLVEWPEVAARLLPHDRVEASFAHTPEGHREVRLRALGPGSRKLLEALRGKARR